MIMFLIIINKMWKRAMQMAEEIDVIFNVIQSSRWVGDDGNDPLMPKERKLDVEDHAFNPHAPAAVGLPRGGIQVDECLKIGQDIRQNYPHVSEYDHLAKVHRGTNVYDENGNFISDEESNGINS